MMKLWLLQRTEAGPAVPTYECSDGSVIAAETEERARQIAGAIAGEEGEGAWLDGTRSSCNMIVPDACDEGIILQDFQHG